MLQPERLGLRLRQLYFNYVQKLHKLKMKRYNNKRTRHIRIIGRKLDKEATQENIDEFLFGSDNGTPVVLIKPRTNRLPRRK